MQSKKNIIYQDSNGVGFENEMRQEVPSLQNTDSQLSNLEEGLNNIYTQKLLNYQEHLNPFTPSLSKIRLSRCGSFKTEAPGTLVIRVPGNYKATSLVH